MKAEEARRSIHCSRASETATGAAAGTPAEPRRWCRTDESRQGTAAITSVFSSWPLPSRYSNVACVLVTVAVEDPAAPGTALVRIPTRVSVSAP